MYKIFFIILAFVVFIYVIYRVYRSYSDDFSFDSSQDNGQAKTVSDKIDSLRKLGRLQEAFAVAKKYLSSAPKDPKARYTYAKLLYDVEKYYDAIGHLNLILRSNPNYSDAILLLGDCFYKTKQNSKSIIVLRSMIEKDPTNMQALAKLANLYIAKKEKKNAIPIYKTMIELTKDNEEKRALHVKIISFYFELREWSNLISEARSVLEQFPNDKSVLVFLKKTYEECGDVNNAIQVIERLIELDPYSLASYEDIIPMLYNNGQFDKTVRYCEAAIKMTGVNKSLVNSYIAKSYIAKKEFDRALTFLKTAIVDSVNDAELKKTLAELYCAINDFEQAITIVEVLIDESGPKDVDALMLQLSNVYFEYGNFLAANNEVHLAFEKYEKAIANNPSNPEFLFVMAELNTKIKNYSEAIRNYKSAIELNPRTCKYYLRLASLYYEIDNILEAKKYFSDAILIQPDSVFAHASIGLINAKQKNADAAISSFQTAINLEPDNTDIRYNLALAYELAGNINKAIEEYKIVLQYDPAHIGAKHNIELLTNMY